MVDVTLTAYEVALVEAVGRARQASAVARGRPDRYGYDQQDPEAVHIIAAGGELAAALAYGLPWTGVYYRSMQPKPADIGQSIEVRTRSRGWHDLIVHPEDEDRWSFVLVIGACPRYRVIGHIDGPDAKQDKYWKDPAGGRPAFFVPQCHLIPVIPQLQTVERL